MTEGYFKSDQEILSGILQARGIVDTWSFFHPCELELYYFNTMPKGKEGAARLYKAIVNEERIFLSVDSDTDGITSGAIMYRWLKDKGVKHVGYYVSQGKSHGTSKELIEKVKAYQSSLLIIMDSLDASIENYQILKETSDILVLDHHDIKPEIPYDDVVTLVSSNRSANPALSGAGVVWKFIKEMDESYFDSFDYDNYTDLAATGLVADMVDMSEESLENRYIVYKGINQILNPALKKIKGFYPFESNTISYSVAPLINASCRYFLNDDAFKCFISDEKSEINASIAKLKATKERQKQDIALIIEGLDEQLEAQKDDLFYFLEIDTPYGLSGLIANKILNQYGKPAFVVKREGDLYAGSGRSALFDLRKLTHHIIPEASANGHPQAFGFTVPIDKADEFKTALTLALQDSGIDREGELVIDCECDPDDITYNLVKGVKELNRVCSQGYKPFLFLIRDCHLIARTSSKGKHLIFENEKGLLYIKWNAENELESLNIGPHTTIEFIGTLDQGKMDHSFNQRVILESYRIINE